MLLFEEEEFEQFVQQQVNTDQTNNHTEVQTLSTAPHGAQGPAYSAAASDQRSPGFLESSQSPGLSTSGNADVTTQFLSTINTLMQQNSQMLQMLQLSQQKTTQVSQEVSNFNIMLDWSKSIDTFTGEKGPDVAKPWLGQVESMALIHR